MRTYNLSEISAGYFHSRLEAVSAETASTIYVNLPHDISDGEKQELVRTAERIRSHVILYVVFKIEYLRGVPYCVMQIACHDLEFVRNLLRMLLALSDPHPDLVSLRTEP